MVSIRDEFKKKKKPYQIKSKLFEQQCTSYPFTCLRKHHKHVGRKKTSKVTQQQKVNLKVIQMKLMARIFMPMHVHTH